MSPRTEAARLAHDEWHAPDGPKAALTGDPNCGTIGCGMLGTFLAIEAEAAAEGATSAVAAARERIEALEKALGAVTDRRPFDSGCPGTDQYGPHEDIVHVAPYHCVPDACDICAALAAPSDAPEKP